MFITFEGLDFCGKSTQLELLKQYAQSRDYPIEEMREPGGTEISEMVRSILLDKKNYAMVLETEIFLYSGARAQLVREKILPYLREGKIVFSDRFHDSTTAYQGYGRGIPLELINRINSFAIGNAVPDRTYLLRISIDEFIARKAKAQSHDRLESLNVDFFKKVLNGYDEISKNDSRFLVLDGSKSIEEIQSIIRADFDEYILKSSYIKTKAL